MAARFDKIYLFTAGVILAVTGLGKLPDLFVQTLCIEDPIFGGHQPFWMTNDDVTGFAAGIELAILVFICYSPSRWLPCLASGLWGVVCLIARLFFIQEGAHCHCLGGADAPTVTVVYIASWLAVGGGIAFWMTWRKSRGAQEPPFDLDAAVRSLAAIALSVALVIVAALILLLYFAAIFKAAKHGESQGGLGFLVAFALPSGAIGLISAIRGFNLRRAEAKPWLVNS